MSAMSSIGARAARAALWNLGYTAVRDVVQFAAMLILVRLLAPDDFGRFGLASAILGFMFVFSARSLLEYAIVERSDERVYWQDWFALGARIELGLFVMTNAGALVLRLVEPYASVAPLLHLMSLLFLTNWPKEICVKMLQRELDWQRFRALWLRGALVSSFLSVGLAVTGFGIYALALPAVILPLVFWQELFSARRWRPHWKWKRARVGPAVRFALGRASSGLLQQGRVLAEGAALSAVLGFGAFGVFGRAMGLSIG